MTVSPDNGEGGRMSYIGLDDTPAASMSFSMTLTQNGEFVPA